LILKIRIGGKTFTFDVDYFRENWGFPFVAGFQLLLMVCAGLLIQGNSGLANKVAVYAFFLLVMGVVLQLASYFEYGKFGDADE